MFLLCVDLCEQPGLSDAGDAVDVSYVEGGEAIVLINLIRHLQRLNALTAQREAHLCSKVSSECSQNHMLLVHRVIPPQLAPYRTLELASGSLCY